MPTFPAYIDDSDETGVSWFNGKYLSAYANYATDRGTNVLDPGQGNWIDAGGGFVNQQYALFGSYRERRANTSIRSTASIPIPASPVTALYGARVWTFAPKDFLSSMGVSGFHGSLPRPWSDVAWRGAKRQSSACSIFSPKARSTCSSSPGRITGVSAPTLTPISQNGGFSFTYHSGMQNNLNNFPTHGSSATPTSIQYYTGNYGMAAVSTRGSATRRSESGDRGALTLTLDDTAQYSTRPLHNIQWFEEIAYAYQVSSNSSFAVGVRHVIGNPPQPNGGGDCEGRCSNISIAYHLRLRSAEIYVAYGNPNTLDHGAAGDLQAHLLRGRREGNVKPRAARRRYEEHVVFALCRPRSRRSIPSRSRRPRRAGGPLQANVLEQCQHLARRFARAGRGFANERSKNSYDRTIELVDVSSGHLTHNVTK